jgi:transketolase
MLILKVDICQHNFFKKKKFEMLNPELKLNPKIFDSDVEQKPIRDGYGDALVELGEKNPNVVVLTADLTESTRCEVFSKKFSDRFFECGVAEQNMVGIASGLAVSGKIPFISSYATFSPGKNWETIRTTIIYNEANVKVAGHHSGIVTGPDGATHQATEDIAITRCWPGIKIIVPCDAIEAKKATIAAAEIEGPVYLRFVRDKTPIITTKETPFELGKAPVFWQPSSDKADAVIFATGHLLYQALLAAKELENEDIPVYVVNVHTIKPLDDETVLKLVEKVRAVVTVEDHQITCGLGGAIAEFLAKTKPTPIEFVGLQDTFAESGKPQELMEKYKLDKTAIKEAVKRVIERKR